MNFFKNEAKLNGGAIFLSLNNYLLFESQISLFENNIAINGGGLYFSLTSTILLKGTNYENSQFQNCFAEQQGGSIFSEYCNSSIENFYFNNSISQVDGGAVY